MRLLKRYSADKLGFLNYVRYDDAGVAWSLMLQVRAITQFVSQPQYVSSAERL